MSRIAAAWLLLTLGAGFADERIAWYFDGDAALGAAGRSGRPIVLLKIRADIGPDVKT